MKNLGTRLKEAREYLGLTQENVAKLMGVSRVIFSRNQKEDVLFFYTSSLKYVST